MHTTTTGATTMTADQIMATQIDAADRCEAAQRKVRIARSMIETRVIGAPLRLQVEDTRRLRAADAALEAVQAAFDAAQDIDCPEADL